MQTFLFDKIYEHRSCVDRDSLLCWLQKDGDSHLIETEC